MEYRMIEVQPGERIVLMNERRLLKFIGWCEAHRASGEYEPGFLTQCMTDLECSTEGHPLDAAAECAPCGQKHPLRDARKFFDQDAGYWYCKDRAVCDMRRLAAESRAGAGHYVVQVHGPDPQAGPDALLEEAALTSGLDAVKFIAGYAGTGKRAVLLAEAQP